MRGVAQGAGEAMALPLQLKLHAVIIPPTGPAFQAWLMLAQPALEQRPHLGDRRGHVDIGLGDMGEFAAKGCQQWPAQGPHKALEVVQFAALAVDQAGADLDDFHLCHGPAAVIRCGFKVNNQPMRHVQVPVLVPS